MARLGLGTVQFGLDYGISNRAGRPDREQVAAILATAARAGIDVLDTAPAYGASETVLGQALCTTGRRFRVVTKTPVFAAPELGPADAETVVDAARASCRKLDVDHLDGLLIHHATDLLKPGGNHLLTALRRAQDEGLVRSIGVSAYDGAQIDAVLDTFTPDLIQLPVNALDRRLLASGHLRRLKDLGVEIHVRSVFLQGLLLMDPAATPTYFEPIRPHLSRLHAQWREVGFAPLTGCLSFALGLPDIDVVLVGVNSVRDLEEITAAAQAPSLVPAVDPIDSAFLNPARWPKDV